MFHFKCSIQKRASYMDWKLLGLGIGFALLSVGCFAGSLVGFGAGGWGGFALLVVGTAFATVSVTFIRAGVKGNKSADMSGEKMPLLSSQSPERYFAEKSVSGDLGVARSFVAKSAPQDDGEKQKSAQPTYAANLRPAFIQLHFPKYYGVRPAASSIARTRVLAFIAWVSSSTSVSFERLHWVQAMTQQATAPMPKSVPTTIEAAG
jgi:hypothetical protein